MKQYPSIKMIKVGLDFGNNRVPVGRLAIRDHRIYFEYDSSFIELGIEISPFLLPLKAGLHSFDASLFEGLPGVFNDSLPDGWGRLVFDRFAQSQGFLPSDFSPLDRLAYAGTHAMGALVYEPEIVTTIPNESSSLDSIARQAQEVLGGSSDDVLYELLALNGSSAGAHPKILIDVSKNREHILYGMQTVVSGYEPWLVKFSNSQDDLDSGSIEYAYACIAKEAGVEMQPVHLFPARQGPGYFATKRFDREGSKRFHMHSVCGLLHSDFRIPSLDYEILISLTLVMTRDIREVEKMFRLAVFNILAHNRDDHAKNFSFLMDTEGRWKLSPAYDLTFSSGPGGEQSTMVMGEGKNPGIGHLIKLGNEANIAKSRVIEIIEQTRSALESWPILAKQCGVSIGKIQLIAKRINISK